MDTRDDDELQPSQFPLEFMGAMSDLAFQTLNVFLETSGAPSEVTGLLDMLMMLRSYETRLEATGGLLPAYDNEQSTDIVAKAARLVARLGGQFHGGYSIYPAERAVCWPAKDAGALQFGTN